MDTEYDYDEELISDWYDDDTLPCGCCACCGCSCDDDEWQYLINNYVGITNRANGICTLHN